MTRSSTTSTGPTGPGARLHGIDEQVAKAERAVAGKVPVKRNRFIRLVGADKSVNRTLEAKARALAGWKGYITNLATCPDGTPVTAEFVIERLPPAVPDRGLVPHVQARPRRPADLPPQARVHRGAPERSCSPRSRSAGCVEERTGWSIRRFVRTARRYRTVQIRAGQQLLTAEDPLPDDLRDALALIIGPEGAH